MLVLLKAGRRAGEVDDLPVPAAQAMLADGRAVIPPDGASRGDKVEEVAPAASPPLKASIADLVKRKRR